MALIRYAGWEPPQKSQRKIPVERARELRALNMTWKQVADRLSAEFEREYPFTADGVQTAVSRAKKERTC